MLTGGHAATTAVSVVEEITKRNKNWKLYWIGPKKAIEGKGSLTSAFKILPDYGVYYRPIFTGRLQRKWTGYTIPSLFKVPVGFIHALILLIKIRPNVVVSFGGYAAFPVVVMAWVTRVPVIVHSQTVALGLANRLSIFFASEIAIARAETEISLPKSKTTLVGNPVMADITKIKVKKTLSPVPVIYITGGSAGSQNINRVVDRCLEKLLKKYHVLHQTGDLDIEHFQNRKRYMAGTLANKYEVFSYTDRVWCMYEKADVVVSRAGANTISEILLTGRPAILIPHPWVVMDEQVKNARLVEKTGLFEILIQDDLTPEALIESLDRVIKNWGTMVRGAKNEFADLDRGASKKFVDILETFV